MLSLASLDLGVNQQTKKSSRNEPNFYVKKRKTKVPSPRLSENSPHPEKGVRTTIKRSLSLPSSIKKEILRTTLYFKSRRKYLFLHDNKYIVKSACLPHRLFSKVVAKKATNRFRAMKSLKKSRPNNFV